jgi:SsrA-binding protein
MKIICQNKKALFEYEIIEKIESGIQLFGSEVKSLRTGGGNLTDGHVMISSGQATLYGFRISNTKHSPKDKEHDPERNKNLLLHSREIAKLREKVTQKGFTIVPLSAYFNKKGILKIELALAKGKQLHDKRESIKKRDLERDRRRHME